MSFGSKRLVFVSGDATEWMHAKAMGGDVDSREAFRCFQEAFPRHQTILYNLATGARMDQMFTTPLVFSESLGFLCTRIITPFVDDHDFVASERFQRLEATAPDRTLIQSVSASLCDNIRRQARALESDVGATRESIQQSAAEVRAVLQELPDILKRLESARVPVRTDGKTAGELLNVKRDLAERWESITSEVAKSFDAIAADVTRQIREQEQSTAAYEARFTRIDNTREFLAEASSGLKAFQRLTSDCVQRWAQCKLKLDELKQRALPLELRQLHECDRQLPEALEKFEAIFRRRLVVYLAAQKLLQCLNKDYRFVQEDVRKWLKEYNKLELELKLVLPHATEKMPPELLRSDPLVTKFVGPRGSRNPQLQNEVEELLQSVAPAVVAPSPPATVPRPPSGGAVSTAASGATPRAEPDDSSSSSFASSEDRIRALEDRLRTLTDERTELEKKYDAAKADAEAATQRADSCADALQRSLQRNEELESEVERLRRERTPSQSESADGELSSQCGEALQYLMRSLRRSEFLLESSPASASDALRIPSDAPGLIRNQRFTVTVDERGASHLHLDVVLSIPRPSADHRQGTERGSPERTGARTSITVRDGDVTKAIEMLLLEQTVTFRKNAVGDFESDTTLPQDAPLLQLRGANVVLKLNSEALPRKIGEGPVDLHIVQADARCHYTAIVIASKKAPPSAASGQKKE